MKHFAYIETMEEVLLSRKIYGIKENTLTLKIIIWKLVKKINKKRFSSYRHSIAGGAQQG